MIICNRCGKPLGQHRQPAIRAACASKRSDPKKVKAAQHKAIDYIRKRQRKRSDRTPFFPERLH